MSTRAERKLKLQMQRKAQPLLRAHKGVRYRKSEPVLPSLRKVNMNKRRK